jgi:hypothetical protein
MGWLDNPSKSLKRIWNLLALAFGLGAAILFGLNGFPEGSFGRLDGIWVQVLTGLGIGSGRVGLA